MNVMDTLGLTPLMWAALRGHEECVNLLLKAGSDANKRNNKGFNALKIAEIHGHEKCVASLQG